MQNNSTFQKIVHFPLVKILVGVAAVIASYGLMQSTLSKMLGSISISEEWKSPIIMLAATAIATFVYVILFKSYEKRKIAELSLKRNLNGLTGGLIIGIALQSLTILVIYLNGGYHVISINPLWIIAPVFVSLFSSAFLEELIFRGILFRIIEEKLGSHISLILTAALFGFAHIMNPNGSIISAIGLSIQAGLLLGIAYALTGNLWFPVGIHFGWNFSQGALFGANISGHQFGKSILVTKIEGADWFTGGPFGPEGSIQATAFCLLATGILLFLSHKKGKIKQPFWKK